MGTSGVGGPCVGCGGLLGRDEAVLLLCVFQVFTLPGPDVTSDVSVIYQGWSEVLRGGAFPAHDVTWQYPPAAALPMLAPGALPFLEYTSAFFVLACAADAVAFGLLLYAGRRPGGRGAAPGSGWPACRCWARRRTRGTT